MLGDDKYKIKILFVLLVKFKMILLFFLFEMK